MPLHLAAQGYVIPFVPRAGAPVDYTDDPDFIGCWLIAASESETELEADRCSAGGTDNVTFQDSPVAFGTVPAGSVDITDSADLDATTGHYFDLADQSEFEATSFTVGCWANHDRDVSDVMIWKDFATNFGLQARNTTEKIRGWVTNNVEETASNKLPLNEWHHVALRYDSAGAGTVEVFVDAANACNGACATGADPTGGTGALVIGADHGGNGRWDGELAECWYADRAITNTELAEIFLCGLQGGANGTTRDSTYGGATCSDIGNLCCT